MRHFKRILWLSLSLLLIFCHVLIPAGAVVPNMIELFEPKLFQAEDGYQTYYWLYVPDDYSADKEYPLVLYMHGAGERGAWNADHLMTGINDPFSNENSPIYDCIVLAPQCPVERQWVDVARFRDSIYSTDLIPEAYEMKVVLSILAEVQETYCVDEDRLYVTGYSMGGYATWDLIVRHPDLFAAAIPICGGADWRKAEDIKHIPIWTFHGLQDTVVPPSGTSRMVTELRAKGATEIQYTTYEDQAHVIWRDIYSSQEVWEWLLSKKRVERTVETSENTEQTQGADVTEAPATAVPSVTEENSPATSTPVDSPSSGCGATLGMTSMAVLGAIGVAAVATGKKKRASEN